MALYTIGAGGDYLNFSAFEAVTSLPEAERTTLQITGVVTGSHLFSSDKYGNGLTLTASAGEEATSKGAGAFIDANIQLVSSTAQLIVNGLRIRELNVLYVASLNSYVENCYIGQNSVVDAVQHGLDTTVEIRNSIIVNASDDGFYSENSDSNLTVSQCTVVDASRYGAVRGIYKNTFIIGSGTGDFTMANGASNYNASSDVTATGANSITSRTTADLEDYAGGDYNIAAASVLNTSGEGGIRIGAVLPTVGANQPPVIDDESFTTSINATNGTVVGTITATDDVAVTGYSITGTVFAIDNSGVITVADSGQLVVSDMTETVAVIDGGGLTDTAIATITVQSVQSTILTVDPVNLGEVAGFTVDDVVDLTTVTALTATYGGLAVTLSNITASAASFTAPSQGLELNASHALVLDTDGTLSGESLQTLLPPTGNSSVTLTTIDADSWLAVPPYSGNGGSDADNMGVGDQVIYQSLTNEISTDVVIDATGIVSMPNGVADGVTVDQAISWFYLDAQDGYASSATQVLTLLAPALDNPTLNITASDSNLLVGEVSTITFTFSEAVTGFDISDVVATNGTMSALSGSGASYNAVFTPSVEFDGVGVISVTGGAFVNIGGDLGVGDNINITIDTVTAPSTSSVLNMIGTGTPDGVYMAKFYDDVLDVLIVSKNVTFSGGSAITTLDVTVGSPVHSLIVGNNPPTTGMAYVGVTV